jgi:hypothetical protein
MHKDKDAKILKILDAAIQSPDRGLHNIASEHGVKAGTFSNWFNPIRPRYSVPPSLVAWFRIGDNLNQWKAKRPQNRLSEKVICAIYDAPPGHNEPELQEDTPSADGDAPFIPQTADDLLVLREQVMGIARNATHTQQKAQELVIAIDLIRDATNNLFYIKQLETKLSSLTSQLALADAQLNQFRTEKLATNQVHSQD